MSKIEGRAQRLFLGLTARERIQLVSQATNENVPTDWRIYAMMPREQRNEFNEYVDLINGAGRTFPVAIVLLERDIRALEQQLVLLSVLVSWGIDRDGLVFGIGEMIPEPRGPEASAAYLSLARIGDGPHPAQQLLSTALGAESLLAGEELNDYDRLMRNTTERVRRDLITLFRHHGAIDAVLTRLRSEVGCDDVLERELRDNLDRARTRLTTALAGAEIFTGELELPEVDTPMVNALWAKIQNAVG